MKAQKNVVRLVIAFLTSATSLVGCSDVRLAPLAAEEVSVSSVGEFCTLSPDSMQRYTKFMFVIDKSGSNGTTDRNNLRAEAIEDFFNQQKNNEFVQWGYIVFGQSGNEAKPYISDPANSSLPVFVEGGSGKMEEAIQLQRSEGDNGCTPYSAAFALTRTAIKEDIKRNPQQENQYMVFFMSDGGPTDYGGGGCSANAPGQAAFDDVKETVDISPGNVFVSTAYYGPQSADDYIEGLRRMGEEFGNGKFMNLERGEKADFNDLIAGGESREPWFVKNLTVYNLSSTYCESTSAFGVDSDGDGLCDADENAANGQRDRAGKIYSFDPRKRFSTANTGFGDYFWWRQLKFGEKLPTCTDKTDADQDMLTKCEEAYVANQTPVSPSPDIIVPKTANPVNPDTDLDGFLDGIEVFAFRLLTSPMNARDVLTDHDREGEAGTQIRQHKHPLMWDPGAFSYDSEIRETGINTSTGQTCYSFNQSRMQLFNTLSTTPDGNFPGHQHATGENLVYLHFIQAKARAPLSRGVLRFSLQKLKSETQAEADVNGHSAGLKINDAVFNTYIVPKD